MKIISRVAIMCVFYIVCTLCSCTKSSSKKISFYYWKQGNEHTTITDTMINKLAVQKFYVHLMDVVWNERLKQSQPIEKSTVDTTNPITQKGIVPVVFISNSVLKNSDSTLLSTLAENIIVAAKNFMKQVSSDFEEIQIDCDWTATTSQKYFYLLQLLKKQNSNIIIGTTIRLYAQKYPKKMGVPPVDYGVLMCYNMADIKDIKTENSITNYNTLKQYLTNDNYPIPLKVAVPVFGWYVWFKNGKYQTILYATPGLTDDREIFSLLHDNTFRVEEDTTISGNYIRRGDLIRNEFPSDKNLKESCDYIFSKLAGSEEVIFYYWDENYLPYYETSIQSISDR